MMRFLPITAGLLACAASAAHAAVPPVPVSREEPVVLEAEQIDYDKATQFIIAQGKVEVAQGDTVLMADTLTYDQKNGIVFAQGNVSVLEASGNVYFADDVELSDRMRRGVVTQMRARLADNSLFAAAEAERVNEDVTVMRQAVYSPCKVKCDDGTPRQPLWQVRADKATIDRAEQEIRYRGASMELWGVPVLYTPYLSHATPGADNRSGLMTPHYRNDDNLGNVVEVPVYWAIAPDKDLTATVMYTSEEAPVLLGEYRQKLDNGQMRLNGSITRPDDRDGLGNPSRGNATRGHFFGDGEFLHSDRWQSGFRIRRTTDDTYLRRYDLNYDALLTSRVYGEGFRWGGSDRSYVAAQGLAFQGMQQQDDARRSPLVLPVVDAFYQTQPMWANSRLSFTGGLMSLTRELGPDSRRVSVAGEWMVPHVTETGHVFEAATQLRADAYDVNDVALPGGALFNGHRERVIPQASLAWRYPLVNRFERSSLVVEPTASLILSPTNSNSGYIPNEDSAVPEFTDTNLFSDNRFAGYDRVETGPRLNYGVRSQWQFGRQYYVSGLLGQAYRTNDDPLFPISNDLTSRFSDYVGRIGLDYAPFTLNYRFRADKDNYELKRNELEAGFSHKWAGFGISYTQLQNDPIVGQKEEMSGGGSMKLSRYWTWTIGAHRDMLRRDFTSASMGFAYQDECVTLNTVLGRSYTSDRDFRESTTIKVQLLLKNLE